MVAGLVDLAGLVDPDFDLVRSTGWGYRLQVDRAADRVDSAALVVSAVAAPYLEARVGRNNYFGYCPIAFG